MTTTPTPDPQQRIIELLERIATGGAGAGGEGPTGAPTRTTAELANDALRAEEISTHYAKVAADLASSAKSAEARVLATEAELKHQEQVLALALQQAELANESADQIVARQREGRKIIDTLKAQLSVQRKIDESNQKWEKRLYVIGGHMAALKKDAVGYMDTFVTGPMAGALITNMKKMAFALNEAEKGFEKNTGLSREFTLQVRESHDALKGFGVEAKEAANAAEKLAITFTDFTMTNKAERQALVDTGALLQELGISNESFAKGIQASTKFFGESARGAKDTAIELKETAKALGVAPSLLADQFASAGKSMAKFGTQGVQAFKDLARVSKITGMEIEKIINMTSKFDTFEGAATQVGKLNAALGTNAVNAMDLLMETDPAARFETIRDAILDTGLTFDNMSYYQKQFYADAAGLEDVGDLALMLSGNMDLMSGAAQQNSADYEKLAREAKKLQTLQEKWQAMLAQATPLLMSLVDIAEKFLSVIQKYGDLIAKGGIAVLGLNVALKILVTTLQLGLIPAALGTKLALGGIVTVIAYLAFLLYQKHFASSFTEGLYKVALGIGAVGIAFLALRGGITGATRSMLGFAASLLTNPVTAILVGITIGIVALIKNWDKLGGKVKTGAKMMLHALFPLLAAFKAIGWVGRKLGFGGGGGMGSMPVASLQEGGITTTDTIARLHPNEAVIPLGDTVIPVVIVDFDRKALAGLMMATNPMLMAGGLLTKALGGGNAFGAALGGAVGAAGAGSEQKISIQLDRDATRDVLEGRAAAASDRTARNNLLST